MSYATDILKVTALPLLNYSSYTYINKAYSSSLIHTANTVKFGIIAGIQFPHLSLRAWVGYNFVDVTSINGNLPTTSQAMYTNGYQNGIFNGYDLKGGLSYSFMKNLAINAEYTSVTYSTFTAKGISYTNTTEKIPHPSDYSSHLLTITVSAPFDFNLI